MIFGLGNPGSSYSQNRHNFGYMVVDHAARKWELEFNLLECRALAAKTGRFKEEALLAKPLTFMNASGSSAALLLQRYGLGAEDLLVVYDDIDLPLGSTRIRRGGGAGFHKGIISIIEKLGTDGFPRLRMGIQGDQEYGDLADYVLSDFQENELSIVNDVVLRSVEALETVLNHGIEQAMRVFNVRNREVQDKLPASNERTEI